MVNNFLKKENFQKIYPFCWGIPKTQNQENALFDCTETWQTVDDMSKIIKKKGEVTGRGQGLQVTRRTASPRAVSEALACACYWDTGLTWGKERQ